MRRSVSPLHCIYFCDWHYLRHCPCLHVDRSRQPAWSVPNSLWTNIRPCFPSHSLKWLNSNTWLLMIVMIQEWSPRKRTWGCLGRKQKGEKERKQVRASKSNTEYLPWFLVALSVGPSVGWSVTLSFFFWFYFLWPHCSGLNGLVTSNMASAHPHATSVAVYPVLLPLISFNRQ